MSSVALCSRRCGLLLFLLPLYLVCNDDDNNDNDDNDVGYYVRV